MGKSISSLTSVFKRHCWPALAALTAVIGASIAYLAVTPKVYQVSARLMMEEKKVSISELGRDLSQGTASVPGGANPLGNQSELVKSEKVVKRAVDQIFPQETESEKAKIVTDKLKKGMKVKIVPATNILELSYQYKDPALATKLINAIAQAMAEESTEALRLEAKAVRQFLEIEVPKRRAAAELAELAENRYRQESGIISFEEQSKSLVSSLSTLEDQERTLSAQLEDVKIRVNKLQKITDNSNPQNAYAAGRIGQDKELIDLRVKLAELDTKLSEAQVRFTDDNPLVISLLQKRDSLLALYNDKVGRIAPSYQNIPPANVASDPLSQNLTSAYIAAETERSALTEKLRALQSERAELKGRLTQLPLKQQPLTALSRQREEATASLKLLQGKLEEAHIAEAQLVGNVRIIEQAKVPELPVGPNQKVVLVIAVVFGAILGVGIIVVLELLDDRLHDGVEAEELLKLPLLGVLPDIPQAALSLEEPDRFLNDTRLVEPYRRLLKTLEFRSQNKIQLIVVSSTLSGEGKSLVVSHLATVSAMLSRRTLIIDANLRQSGEQNFLNIPGAAWSYGCH
ncbi:MAG: GNVR domain-containing protein [Potamolinea sp.]